MASIQWLIDTDETNEIAELGSGTEQRLAWTCQHWQQQAIRCADQAEGLRRRAVQLGLGKFAINKHGEREFHYDGDYLKL